MSDRSEVKSMAVFCDFENIALGVRDAEYEKFDMRKVLERLLLKGSIVVKKAYCDWDRYKAFKAAMHEASFELIEIPHVRQSGKNSADIRMVVDALDLCYTKSHVDTFVIISGDSDFSPLVSKLRENAKNVIGVGVKNSTSDLLIANCDEFIFYDDLVREQRRRAPAKRAGKTAGKAEKPAAKSSEGEKAPVAPEKPAAKSRGGRKQSQRGARAAATAAETSLPAEGLEPEQGALEPAPDASSETGAAPSQEMAAAGTETGGQAENGDAREGTDEERRQRAFELVLGTLEGLLAERGDNDTVWGSMVKQTLKRRQPGFNEAYYGFRSFNALLEEAQARGLIVLARDDKSGGFKVRLAERVD